ncbi:MAG: DNA-binding domain-containing protein [Planctomycetaceae bacterium]
MTGDLRELRTIQRWMQAVITHPGGVEAGIASPDARANIDVPADEAERVVTRSQSLDALRRLQIYANAYYARLLECLREEFPALVHALGEEVFDGFAFGYLQSHPPRSYTLAMLAADFPRYLRETRPQASDELRVTSDEKKKESLSESPTSNSSLVTRHSSLDSHSSLGAADWPAFIIDLATLERTYSEVFDGPGVEGERLLGEDDLRAIAPDEWPHCRLVTAECLRLAAFDYPVHEYASAVRHGQSAEIPPPRATWLAITRRDYVVRRIPLSFPQFKALEALTRGATVGEALERAAEAWEGEFDDLAAAVAGWFREWAAAGHFRRVETG